MVRVITCNELVVGSSPTFPTKHRKEKAMENKTITIDEEEYLRLLADAFWLMCLEQAGVDNWDGYSYAIDLKEEYENE